MTKIENKIHTILHRKVKKYSDERRMDILYKPHLFLKWNKCSSLLSIVEFRKWVVTFWNPKRGKNYPIENGFI